MKIIHELHQITEFPILVIHIDYYFIVLITKFATGMVLKEGNSREKVGEYSDAWDMSRMIPVKGKLIMENDS